MMTENNNPVVMTLVSAAADACRMVRSVDYYDRRYAK